MRWTTPHDKDRRVIKRFLFIPRRINYEARWLEVAYIEQEYIEGRGYSAWVSRSWTNRIAYAMSKGVTV